jgi:hypothetical protein
VRNHLTTHSNLSSSALTVLEEGGTNTLQIVFDKQQTASAKRGEVLLATWEEHRSWIYALAVLKNEWVISGGRDKVSKCWEVDKQGRAKCLATWKDYMSSVLSPSWCFRTGGLSGGVKITRLSVGGWMKEEKDDVLRHGMDIKELFMSSQPLRMDVKIFCQKQYEGDELCWDIPKTISIVTSTAGRSYYSSNFSEPITPATNFSSCLALPSGNRFLSAGGKQIERHVVQGEMQCWELGNERMKLLSTWNAAT